MTQMSAATSSEETPTPRRRPGGRTARVGASVLAATLDLLSEGGFASLTIDQVADRSGVHKTTIYRRWGSREGLVGAALASRSATEVPIPDTDTLRGDLTEIARAVAANLSSPLGRALAQTMVGHADDPEIRRITEEFWSTRFAHTDKIVERAIERGELASETDPRLVIEAVVAPVWFRSIAMRAPAEREFIAAVVDVVLNGFDRE